MDLISIPEKDFKSVKELELFPDGTLIEYQWDDGVKREYQMVDISDEIIFHLDQHIVLAPGVKLNSLFSLISRNEVDLLNIIFHNCFLDSFIAHYKTIDPSTITPYTSEYSPDKIDYLELHWYLYKNTRTRELSGYNRPDFGGVGVEQLEDYLEDGLLMVSKGGRMSWGIDFQPLIESLDIPLVLNSEAEIIEADHQNKNCHNVIETVIMEFTLRDLIQGVFWELSFYGTPAEKQDVKNELDSRPDDIKDDTAKIYTFDELRNELSDLDIDDADIIIED